MLLQHLRIFAMIVFAATVLIVGGCSAPSDGVISSSAPDQIVNAEAVNINTASAAELQSIPHVGERLAERIIEYRTTHGPFRKPEHLMLVQGISDKRFRQIRAMIRTE
jgi:competence protein ComEA